MYRWSLQTKQLPLKFTWKISRGESREKTLYFIRVTDSDFEGVGEVAGITADPKKADWLLKQFENFKKSNLESLEEIENSDLPSHLKFGISSALTHLLVRKKKINIFNFLDVKNPKKIITSFSLPILPVPEIRKFFEEYQLNRFKVLKLKISKNSPTESCRELARLFNGPIRVDANEAFDHCKEVLDFLDTVSDLNLEFIEEPLARGSVAEYKKLFKQSPFPIFADESVQDGLLTIDMKEKFHGINVKLMKAGSYTKALKQINQAKEWNMKVMLGCMVESSLGIAGAMAISQNVDYFDLDGFLYFENEPHHLVTENNGELTYQHNPSFPLFY